MPPARVFVVFQEVFDLLPIVHQLEDRVGAIGWEFAMTSAASSTANSSTMSAACSSGSASSTSEGRSSGSISAKAFRDQLRRQLPDQPNPEFVIQRRERVRQIGRVNLLGLRTERLHVSRLG